VARPVNPISHAWHGILVCKTRSLHDLHTIHNVIRQQSLERDRSPGARLIGANFEQIREEAVNAVFITNEEVAQVLTPLDDPNFAFNAPIMFTAWGRRPLSPYALS
jgi:hypothetical protein